MEFAYFLKREGRGTKYPESWVVIQDGQYTTGNTLGTLIDGVVVDVFTSEQYFNTDCRWKYDKSEYSCEKTLPHDGVYINGLEYVYPASDGIV